jgi:hypothetical protein
MQKQKDQHGRGHCGGAAGFAWQERLDDASRVKLVPQMFEFAPPITTN